MSTAHVIPGLDDMRERLHNFILGFAQHKSDGVRPLIDHGWRHAAAAELRRRATLLVEALDHELLTAIARGDINVPAEASYLAFRLTEAEEEDAIEVATLGGDSPPTPPAIQALRETIEALALKHFGITTLETRKRDSLDYHSVPVWCMREALSEAFYQGYRARLTAETPSAAPGRAALSLSAKREALRESVSLPTLEEWGLVCGTQQLVDEVNAVLLRGLDALRAGEIQGKVRYRLFEELVLVHQSNKAACVLDSEGMSAIAAFFAVNYDPALYDFMRYYSPFTPSS